MRSKPAKLTLLPECQGKLFVINAAPVLGGHDLSSGSIIPPSLLCGLSLTATENLGLHSSFADRRGRSRFIAGQACIEQLPKQRPPQHPRAEWSSEDSRHNHRGQPPRNAFLSPLRFDDAKVGRQSHFASVGLSQRCPSRFQGRERVKPQIQGIWHVLVAPRSLEIKVAMQSAAKSHYMRIDLHLC